MCKMRGRVVRSGASGASGASACTCAVARARAQRAAHCSLACTTPGLRRPAHAQRTHAHARAPAHAPRPPTTCCWCCRRPTSWQTGRAWTWPWMHPPLAPAQPACGGRAGGARAVWASGGCVAGARACVRAAGWRMAAAALASQQRRPSTGADTGGTRTRTHTRACAGALTHTRTAPPPRPSALRTARLCWRARARRAASARSAPRRWRSCSWSAAWAAAGGRGGGRAGRA